MSNLCLSSLSAQFVRLLTFLLKQVLFTSGNPQTAMSKNCRHFIKFVTIITFQCSAYQQVDQSQYDSATYSSSNKEISSKKHPTNIVIIYRRKEGYIGKINEKYICYWFLQVDAHSHCKFTRH